MADFDRIFGVMKGAVKVLWWELPGGFQFVRLELYKEGLSIGACRRFVGRWRVRHGLSMRG